MQNLRLNDSQDKGTELTEKTPVMRCRKSSDIPNSNLDLMNKKLLEQNQDTMINDDSSPKMETFNDKTSCSLQINSTAEDEKDNTFTRDLKFLQRMLYYFKFFSEFILRDFKIKPLNNVISVSTIVLLIVFLGLINVMMSLSPMIYLMMSEQEVGESDMMFFNPMVAKANLLTPSIDNLFIDYKKMNDAYCEKYLKGCSSRFHLKGMQTVNSQEIFSDVLLLDVMKEEQIGLGRRVKLSELKSNECYISRNLYTLLTKQVKGGQITKTKKPRIVLDMTLGLILSTLPRLQSEDAIQSYQMKKYFIASLLDKQFKQDGVRFTKVQDIIYHYVPKNLLNQEYQSYIDSFDFEGYLGFKKGDTLLGQDESYTVCIGLAQFLLDIKFTLPLEVKDFIDNSVGKFEDKLSNVIIIDYNSQFDFILSQLCSSFIRHLTDKMASYSITYYALMNLKQDQLFTQLLSQARRNFDVSFFHNNAIVLFGVYKDKQNVYLEEKKIVEEVKAKSNSFTDVFGLNYPVVTAFPLSLTQIYNLKQKQILDNSYNCGVILLIALSSVIIYSVSQSSIQQKVQEYGVVRIIGYSTKSLIIFSLLKAIIFYMIPALILAEGLNMIILHFIKSYFYDLLQFSTDLSQEYSNTYYATTVLLGICLPLFCNLYPFKQFFEKQVLSQAINVHQRVLQQTKVIIQKLEKYGISFYAIVNSVILIFVGILAYYFAPYAFVTKQIGLFLMIVNLTFLMVNVGISCLVNLVQRKLEIGWIRCVLNIFCRKDQNLESSITNNFNNNNLRMQKLGMIIMMIFSFYISIGSSVNSQIMMVKNMVKLNIGSDYLLQVENEDISLDEAALIKNLEKFKEKNPDIIKAYSFVSKNIKSITGFQKGGRIRNYVGGYVNWDFLAISPNFIDSIYNELFIPDIPLTPDQNPSNSLYHNNGTSIGQYLSRLINYMEKTLVFEEQLASKDSFQVLSQIKNSSFINQNLLVEHTEEQYILYYVSAKDRKALSLNYGYHMDYILGATRFKGKPVGFAKKVPGFKSFTENPIFSLLQNSEVFVSYQQFEHIMRIAWEIQGFQREHIENVLKQYPENLSYNVPKDQLFIKLNDDIEVTQSQRNMLKSYLTEKEGDLAIHQDNQSVTLYETYSILTSLDYLIKFWNLLFNLISLFIFTLTYYLLTITFKQNVQENLHNIKIYKSIGLSHSQVQKIFIYEGVTVMIINGLIGLIIGMVLSIMIQQQLIVFLEMPFDLQQIPYQISSLLFAMCIALSIYTSKNEIDLVKFKQISEIDR